MKVKSLIKQLEKVNGDAKVVLHGKDGIPMKGYYICSLCFLLLDTEDVQKHPFRSKITTAKELKDALMEADDKNIPVLTNSVYGGTVTYVDIDAKGQEIWLKCEDDLDADNLKMMFGNFIAMYGLEELEVYESIMDAGVTVETVEKLFGEEVAKHMENFCQEHGLM